MPKIQVMKQIDDMLTRHLIEDKRPLRRKWIPITIKAQFDDDVDQMHVYHYHHLVLKLDLSNKRLLYTWYERPADKRGLNSCLAWLKQHGYIDEIPVFEKGGTVHGR